MELVLNKEKFKKYKIKIVAYMTRKEIWSHDYIRYNLFKKMISHITKLNNNYELRQIFLFLVSEGVFLKRKNQVRSYLYKFVNPSIPKIQPRQITISFD